MPQDADDRSVAAAPDVLLQELPGGQAVLLNTRSEAYFGLDAVGTSMWSALVAAGTVDAARAQLEGEYDVDAAQLARDLDDFVRELVERRLLVVDA
jgi:ornithine carbamoyltransferase